MNSDSGSEVSFRRRKLTKRSVEALPRPSSATGTIYWDTELPGFGVRVFPSGRRRFVARYHVRGRSGFVTLGKFGSLTVDEARKEAKEVLLAAQRGADPAATRREALAAPTIRDLAARYLEEHAETHKKASSVRMDRWYLIKFILPALGPKQAAAIEARDIARLHHRLRATPYNANRVRALLSKLLSLAETWGLRPLGSNPVRLIPPFKEKRRERYLSGEEIERLGAVLREVEAENEELPEALAAIRLLLLTGCRSGEVLSLRWTEVDFERRRLRLVDSKTGPKTVPLATSALALLARLPRVEGNPYVLPGRKDGAHLVNLKDPWRRIRRRAGIPDVRIHDLRHSFASYGASAGAGLPILGKLLGHRSPSTTARYAHVAPDPVQETAERIAGGIAAALDGRQSASVARVNP